MTYSNKYDILKSIGANIKYERLKLHLTPQQLAETVGLSTQMIISIEKGTRGTTIENLIKLADIFNVSLDYIVGRDVSAITFSSPDHEMNKESVELCALCESLTAEQTTFVLNLVKNLIAYTDDITGTDIILK